MDGNDDKATAPKPNESLLQEHQELDEKTQAVANQTPDVVWGFLNEYNQAQFRRSNSGSQRRLRHFATQTDDLSEIEEIVRLPASRVQLDELSQVQIQDPTNARLARQLRLIAEDMEQTYRHTVITLVNKWLLDLHQNGDGRPLTLRVVLSAFQRVVKTVLDSGITWGKLLLLLIFAYEIAVTLYIEGIPQFIRDMISFFVRFLIESPAMRWIAEHGGWAAATTALWLANIRGHITMAAPVMALILSVGVVVAGAFLFLRHNK